MAKIIFTFWIGAIGTGHNKSWNSQPSGRIGQPCKFDLILKKTKKMKKPSKNEILVHGALLCELVTAKSLRLAIPHVWKKNLHRMAYLLWTCLDFKADAQGHGKIHGIVHNNMSKFGTTMGVTIVDNVCIAIIYIFWIKTYFSIFLVQEMTFFVK